MKLLKWFLKATLMSVLIVFTAFTPADEKIEIYDLTNTDLTRVKAFNSTQTSIFGIMVGMRMEEVERKVKENDRLMLEDDQLKKDRFYLYDVINGKKNECLAYFIWDGVDVQMQRMVLYRAMGTYMSEEAGDLFSSQALDPESFIYREILGKPGYKKVTLNVEKISLKHTSYFYPGKKIELVKQKYDGEIDFMLVMHN